MFINLIREIQNSSSSSFSAQAFILVWHSSRSVPMLCRLDPRLLRYRLPNMLSGDRASLTATQTPIRQRFGRLAKIEKLLKIIVLGRV